MSRLDKFSAAVSGIWGDRISVAHSGGSVPRNDRCAKCGGAMLYVVGEHDKPFEMFCQNSDCDRFLAAEPCK